MATTATIDDDVVDDRWTSRTPAVRSHSEKKQNKQPHHTESQNGIESLEIDYLKRTKNQNKKINLQPIQRVGDDRCGIISAGKEEQKEEEEEEEEEGGGGGGGDDDDGGGGRE